VTPEMVTTLERTIGAAAGSMSPEQFNQTAVLLSAQSALTSFFVFAGIILMIFAEPPFAWFAGGAPFRGRNWLPIAAAAALFAGYLVILAVPRLRGFFMLVPLPTVFYAAIAALTMLWVLVQRFVWRAGWLARFLDLADGAQPVQK